MLVQCASSTVCCKGRLRGAGIVDSLLPPPPFKLPCDVPNLFYTCGGSTQDHSMLTVILKDSQCARRAPS
eukprot:4898280-Pyramimonas_sp.AAC.1